MLPRRKAAGLKPATRYTLRRYAASKVKVCLSSLPRMHDYREFEVFDCCKFSLQDLRYFVGFEL